METSEWWLEVNKSHWKAYSAKNEAEHWEKTNNPREKLINQDQWSMRGTIRDQKIDSPILDENEKLKNKNVHLNRENEKLIIEISKLKRKLSFIENDIDGYKRRKELDPYGEENWDN